jgi:hypothetical protein
MTVGDASGGPIASPGHEQPLGAWHALAVCGGGTSMGDASRGGGRRTRTAHEMQLIDDEPRRPGEPAGMVGYHHRLTDVALAVVTNPTGHPELATTRSRHRGPQR